MASEYFQKRDGGYLSISNFSVAKKMTESRTFTFCGVPEYMAPEII